MYSNNKELTDKELNVLLLQNNIAVYKSNLYPKIYANAGVQQGFNGVRLKDQAPQKGTDSNFYLGFSLQYTLFDGNQTKRDIKRAGMEEKIGQLEIRELRQQLSNGLKKQILVYEQQQEILRINEHLLGNTLRNLNLAEDLLNNGLTDFVEYRNVQKVYMDAVKSKWEAMYELKKTKLDIIRLVGGITKNTDRQTKLN